MQWMELKTKVLPETARLRQWTEQNIGNQKLEGRLLEMGDKMEGGNHSEGILNDQHMFYAGTNFPKGKPLFCIINMQE